MRYVHLQNVPLHLRFGKGKKLRFNAGSWESLGGMTTDP